MTPSPTTPSKGSESGGNNAVEFEPPLASIRRILKNSLPASTNVGKDASAAFARASGIFVIYLTTCANDYAREQKRQTITASDVLAAIKELDFDEFTPQLEAFLAQYRADEQSKKDAKAKNKAAQSAIQDETKTVSAIEPMQDDDVDVDDDEKEESSKVSENKINKESKDEVETKSTNDIDETSKAIADDAMEEG